jgi:hypothetical protein
MMQRLSIEPPMENGGRGGTSKPQSLSIEKEGKTIS